jgi:hypothetical protein
MPPPLPASKIRWAAWAVALSVATASLGFDACWWIAINEPHAFGGRDAGGGMIIAAGFWFAGLAVGLCAWIAAARLSVQLGQRARVATLLAPILGVGIGAVAG